MTRTAPVLRSILPLSTLLAACGAEPEPRPVLDGAALSRFESCEALRSYVTDAWTEELVQSRYGYYGWGGVLESDEGGAEDGGDSGGGEAPSDWSETNVQEEGVDEPDLVKTNGTHLFVAHGRVLDILASWPAEDTEHVGRIELEGNPFGLFLVDDRAVVLSSVWEYSEGGGKGEPEASEDGADREWSEGTGEVPEWNDGLDQYYRTATRVSVVDVSDPAAPALVRTLDLEGQYTDARRIDGDMYVVSNVWSSMPDELWQIAWSDDYPELSYDADQESIDAVTEQVRRAIRPKVASAVADMPLSQLLPEQALDGAAPELQLDCTDVYHPQVESSPSVLSLTHVDLDDDGASVSSTGLMADGWEVYASQDHLYVAQTSWWWWGWWGDSEAELETAIHRFDLQGGESVYSASGTVPGWLLNSYSMGEHEGYLRAATTDLGWWWDEEAEPASRVVVLEEQQGSLEIVGALEGIAPNEQIYSCRFMGDVGYMVTFERVDPLFTLDLSDPTDPRILGELKVTGYSSYLHPAGEDHLLAVGMEADEDGQVLGFSVSLFDISDLSDPTLADRITIESDDWSWSESLWEPHAFTWHRDTLAVPLYTSDFDDETGDWTQFSGLYVASTDLEAGSLSEVGRVDHSGLIEATECPTFEGSSEDDWTDDCYDWDAAWMRRSVVIEDWLFSVSNLGVAVSPLDAPGEVVAEVAFYPAD